MHPQKKTLTAYLRKEFKVMSIKMLTNLGRRMEEHSKNFNKERKYKKVPNRSYN